MKERSLKVFVSTEKPSHPNFEDLINVRRGSLVITEFLGKTDKSFYFWTAKCDCGNKIRISSSNFRRTTSCGCVTRAKIIKSATTHGKTKTTEWSIWRGIRKRCLCKKDQVYHRYGGRGIDLCPEWTDSFEAFLRDVGPRPSMQHTLDRIDNNKGYSKENCRWTDWKTQSRNRRNNHLITFRGETKCLIEWGEQFGIRKDTLRRRLVVYKWSIEEALLTPVIKRKKA